MGVDGGVVPVGGVVGVVVGVPGVVVDGLVGPGDGIVLDAGTLVLGVMMLARLALGTFPTEAPGVELGVFDGGADEVGVVVGGATPDPGA